VTWPRAPDVVGHKDTVPVDTAVKEEPRRAESKFDVDKFIVEATKPHPLMVKQAEAREQTEARKQAELLEQAHHPEMRINRKFHPVEKIDRYGPQPPVCRADKATRFDDPTTYDSLVNKAELQNEAQHRGLALHKELNMNRTKDVEYLVEVLIIDDKAFRNCRRELECQRLNVEQLRDMAILKQASLDSQRHYSALELVHAIARKAGQDAVDRHNSQLREKEAAQVEALVERHRQKAREADEEKAVMMGRAMSKRKISPPRFCNGSDQKQSKGTKRYRSNDDGGDDLTPKEKKLRTSYFGNDDDEMMIDEEEKHTPPVKTRCSKKPTRATRGLPRAMQARAKEAETELPQADVAMSDGVPSEAPEKTSPPHGRNTRSNKNVELLKGLEEVEEMKDAEGDEEEIDEDNFIVDDGPKDKRKLKSHFGEMAKSGLISGMK
jgi:hypothetical protein